MEQKTCIKCNQTKTLDFFEKGRNACKKCRTKAKLANQTAKGPIPVTVAEWCCGKCKITKPASEFNKDPKRHTGLTFACKPCRKPASKKQYQKDSEKIKVRSREYYQENKPEILLQQNEYNKKRRKEDPFELLKHRLRGRLWYALERSYWKKDTKFSEYIGCSREQLVEHIEKQFKKGMSWENRSLWHIDHIIPLSSATTAEEMYKLCHYTNLQPLWAADNIRKGAKF